MLTQPAVKDEVARAAGPNHHVHIHILTIYAPQSALTRLPFSIVYVIQILFTLARC